MVDSTNLEIVPPCGNQDPDKIISQKLSTKAHRTLGVWITLDGSWNKELKHLKATAKKFSQRLLSKKLSTVEALIAYWTMYILSTTYSAGITWLLKQQCQEIEKIF